MDQIFHSKLSGVLIDEVVTEVRKLWLECRIMTDLVIPLQQTEIIPEAHPTNLPALPPLPSLGTRL